MNRSLKNFVAFTLLLSALTVTAEPAPSMIVRISKGDDAKSIALQLANLQKYRTQIAVQDLAGKLWYSEYVEREDGFAQKLDLSALPDGAYICFVKNRAGEYTRSFSLRGTALVFFENGSKCNSGAAVFVHTGKERPAMARIAAVSDAIRLQLNNLMKSDVLIQLHVPGVGVAFQEQVSGENGYAKMIRLGGMDKGNYLLYLKIGNTMLMQHLELTKEGVQMGALEHLDQASQDGADDMAGTK